MASIIASARRQLARAGKQLTAASSDNRLRAAPAQTCPVDIVVVYKVDRLIRAQVASAAPWFAPDSALEEEVFEPSVPPSKGPPSGGVS